MCGKTSWALKLLRQMDKVFDKVPKRVYYFYNQHNEAFEANDLHHVTFVHGLPTEDLMQTDDDIPRNSLIILDDFMQSILL